LKAIPKFYRVRVRVRKNTIIGKREAFVGFNIYSKEYYIFFDLNSLALLCPTR
jgi:hypothetical protein